MNEDFVSFSLAKKLKEKGFNEVCLAYYTNDDTLYYNYSHRAGACYKDCYLSHNLMPKDSVSGKFVDAPTISQVLKWLREEKKRFVVIHPTGHDVHYYYTVHNLARSFDVIEYTQSFATYEEAALAGIEYVIDNLI